MRVFVTLVVVSVLASTGALAQPARPTDRDALRAGLITQAREARGRQDFSACTSYLEAATAIRADTLVRYSAALCAFQGGLLPEARRIAHACLHEREGDAEHLRACQRLIVELDQLEASPAPSRASPPTTSQTPPAAPPRPNAPPVPHEGPTPRRAPTHGVPAGAVAVWVVGGASLVFSAVGLALYADAVGPCASQGGAALCPDAASAVRAADAGTWASATNVTFSLGLAAVAGGAAWWLVDRATRSNERAPAARVSLSPFGVALSGTF